MQRAAGVRFDLADLSLFRHVVEADDSEPPDASPWHEEPPYEAAVDDVAQAARKLLTSLHTHAPARDRDVEAEKARARAILAGAGIAV